MEQLEMLQEVEVVDPGYLFQAIQQVALESYWFYLRVILDYRWVDPWFHGEEIVAFIDDCYASRHNCAVIVPRDHGKSGLITQPRPAWEIARNKYGRCVILNAVEQKAAAMAKASADIITANVLYKKCFPEIQPDQRRWGASGYNIRTDVGTDAYEYYQRIDPSLSSYGTGGNVTGSHPDALLVIDDLISHAMAKHPDQVRGATDFFREAINISTVDTFVIVCNTRWTYHDYCGAIVRGELTSKRGAFRVMKRGVYEEDRVTGKRRIIWPRQEYEAANGKTVTVGWTWEQIEDQKKTSGHWFSALYLNEPVASEDIRFNLELIKKYNTEQDLPFRTGPVARLIVENEGQQKALIDAFRTQLREKNMRIPLYEAKTGRQDKDSRILATLQPWISEGKFNARRDMMNTDYDTLGREMENFPKGNKDCLDSVSYGIASCANDGDQEVPLIHVAVDPAFSDKEYSAATAISACCRYRGEVYVLDVVRLETNSTHSIIVMAFNLCQKYENLLHKEETKKTKPRMVGYSSYGSGRRRRKMGSPSVDIDWQPLTKPE